MNILAGLNWEIWLPEFKANDSTERRCQANAFNVVGHVVPALCLNLPRKGQVWCSMCSRRLMGPKSAQWSNRPLNRSWVTWVNQISPVLSQAVEKRSHIGDTGSLTLHLISLSFEATYFPQGSFLKLWPFNLGEQNTFFFKYIKEKLNFVCFLPDSLTFWNYVFCCWEAFPPLRYTINSLLFTILLTTALQ